MEMKLPVLSLLIACFATSCVYLRPPCYEYDFDAAKARDARTLPNSELFVDILMYNNSEFEGLNDYGESTLRFDPDGSGQVISTGKTRPINITQLDGYFILQFSNGNQCDEHYNMVALSHEGSVYLMNILLTTERPPTTEYAEAMSDFKLSLSDER